VVDYSQNYSSNKYDQKYNYLSAFMSSKADKIRKCKENLYEKDKLETQTQTRLRRNQSNRWKFSEDTDVKLKNHHKALRSLSYNPDSAMSTASLLKKNKSLSSKSNNLPLTQNFEDPILSKLIGYIDPFGMFKLNIHQNEVYLLSTNMTEKLGFFDKLSFESSLKDWHAAMAEAFLIHKEIIKDSMFLKKEKRMKLLKSKILNWGYFDNLQAYAIEEKDLTCYNNPILP